MRNVNKFLAFLGLTTACFVAAATSAYAGVAGHVQFVSGNVQVISSVGLSRTAQKGDAINEGDTLSSAQQSSAQIKMQDGGFIAVRPNTKLKIEQFKFSGKPDGGSDRSFFSLIKGGFRSITGLIGQVNKQNYRVTTPAATIGIRGTDYEAIYVEAAPVNVAAADTSFIVAQADVPAPIVGGGFAAAVVNRGAIEMGTDKGKTLLQPGQGMVVSYGMNQLPVIKPLDANLFPGAEKDKPGGQSGSKGSNGEKKDDAKKDDAKKEAPKQEQESSGKNGESDKSAGNGQESADGSSQSTADGGANGETTAGGGTAAATQETAPIRETAVVDAAPASTGAAPAAITPAVTTSTNVTAAAATPANTQTVPTTTTIAGGTTVNLTTGTATTSTGQTVPITQSLFATQAQAAASSAAQAALAAQAAAQATALADTTLAAIAPVPVTLATSAIATATSELSLATTAVNAAAVLTPANSTAAAANAASAQTAAANATTQANAAQAALTANGAFADSTAGTANAAVQAANGTLQTANTSVQSAAATVTAQNNALTAAKTAAATALTNAGANLSTASNTHLATATAQNAVIANAQLAIPAQVTAAQTAAATAQTAAAAAQVAAAQAATLQAAGDLVGAQAQLAIAQQQLAIAQTAQTAAVNAQTAATNQLNNAQAAATAASTAVTNAADAANLAASDALTAGVQASAAQAAASSGAAALALTDPTVSTSPAGAVQLQSTVVTQQAPIAAYNNPAVATPDRFVGVMSTVKADAGGGYVEGYGPGAGFTGTGTANTSFVLDGAGNLVEKRHAWYEETAASTATPQIVVVDANVKRTGGVAAETFKMPDNSIYVGRWVGGTITVSDNNATPIPTFSRNLGVTSEHWAIMLMPTAGYVQTLGGSYTYNKVAATSPTDSLGNVGVLNSATLTANFTAQLVDATLNLSISGKTLDVVAASMAINGSSFSTATQATASCTGCAGTYYANVGGGFAGDSAASAGLNYTLWTGTAPGATTGAADLIQGMAAFSTPTAPTPPAIVVQPFVQTDVSFGLSANNWYGFMPIYYGGSSMTAAANVAPAAATPSFSWSEGCTGCGSYAVTLPGASGAVNGNATSFATTGIQFGRWTDVPTLSQASASIAFGAGKNYGYGPTSWAFAPEGYLDTPTMLSAATGGTAVGVFSYALNGAPAPKDSSGQAGTLNSLSLTADFTAQTVTAALSVSMGATTWNASSASPMGIGAFNGASAGFGGNLNVTSSNASVSTYGYLSGAFTGQNYAGAIVDYQIQEWPLAGGALTNNVSGVAALTRNVAGNATIVDGVPVPTGKFVVAEAGSYGIWNQQTVDTATTTGGVLTSYGYNTGVGNTSTTTINCITCTGQFASDLATGIQFGTWDEGMRANNFTTPFGGQLHWISGPGLDPIYLPEVLLGNMSYALDGGTAPTNQSGATGTLSSASLTVNFTNQTVDLALGLTGVNGHNWSATATGVPLSWTNYSKNGFWSNTGATLTASDLVVTMDGSTAGSGYVNGQLTGSGLNGALFQYQLNASTAMPTVPSTFVSADMVAVQAPSVTVTGPVATGDPVSIAFPAGVNGTLAVQPATALNMGLDVNGAPVSATLSGGVAASVAALTPDAFMSTYSGMAASGETFSMETYGWSYSARYSDFGEWRLLPTPAGLDPVTATGAFSSGEFAGGTLPTSAASMPTSNFTVSGNYFGTMVGGAQDSSTNTPYSLNYGLVNLTANFATGALSGMATGIQVLDRTTGGFVGYFNDLSLAATISTNGFSGSVTANSTPAGLTASPVNVTVGTVGVNSGHFYGPQANELTGVWQLSSGTIKASGAFGAGNGTSFNAPFEMVNGVVALVATAPANTATPYRLVGMSAYDPMAMVYNGNLRADGGYNNASRVTEVAGGVTAFDAGFGTNNMIDAGSSRYAIGTATQTGLGTDPVSGISWGRWVGGMVDITDRATGVVTPSALGASSLHWIATPSMTAPVALPTTGTYSYVLAGGTAPTDNLGNVGTLNSASLVANFTSQTVDVGVNVGISNASGAATLVASGTGIPIQQRAMFSAQTYTVPGGGGQLTASCSGAGCITSTPGATINGAFTGATGAGAAMIYGFDNGGSVVNGVAAFHR